MRAFLRRLGADGYDGLITLEIHPWYLSQFDRTQAVRQLAQSVEFVHEALGETGRITKPTPAPQP